jgi:hypothetical protein
MKRQRFAYLDCDEILTPDMLRRAHTGGRAGSKGQSHEAQVRWPPAQAADFCILFNESVDINRNPPARGLLTGLDYRLLKAYEHS